MANGALVWDKELERKFETGTDHGVLYTAKDTVEQGANTKYNDGVVWNGLTGVTESPEGGEPNDLWADNIKYATLRSTETFGFTIEAYMYPNEFAECDGSAKVVDGVYVGQQDRKAFGFCYRTWVGDAQGSNLDDHYKLHIIWNATASPSERSYETVNDSPDAITFSWDCTTVPTVVSTTYGTGNKKLKPMSEIIVDSSAFSGATNNLKALEAILFGQDADAEHNVEASAPRLPEPDAVLKVLMTGSET